MMKIILFICLFSSSFVFFKVPFEFYFHYVFFLTLLPFFIYKYGVPKFIVQLLFIPLIVGLIHIGLTNNDSFSFTKILVGLLVTILFFYYVIIHVNFNIKYLFNLYVRFCFVLVVIGIAQLISYLLGFSFGYNYSWVFNKWGLVEGGLLGIRLNSILSEPAQLAIVLSPAVYVAVRNLLHRDHFILNKYQSILVLLVSLLTTSSIGLFGMILSFLFNTNSFRLRYFLFGFVITIISYNLAYNYIPEFKTRVDSAIGLWINEDFSFENTNSSSFVLYNNIHIAKESVLDHPFFGTSLGSYENMFNRYTLTRDVINYDFEFNIKDGNSLLIRLFTETGIVGVFFVTVFLIRCYVREDSNKKTFNSNSLISNALLMLIILSLIRQGNYMLNGLPLIFLIYYYNSIDYKNSTFST